MKISNDTIGNRTRILAQCLNQLRHRVELRGTTTPKVLSLKRKSQLKLK
jgi:hypothetical protein